MPGASQRILLVRHGRSAHVQRGSIDLAGFHRWRDAYEAAGIDEQDQPHPAVTELAAGSGIVVASTAPRALQSAMRLWPARDIVTSPLLRELELIPPNIRGVRMPLMAWALTYGLQWLVRAVRRRPHLAPAELQRAREAAEWLSDLADEHGTVLAVTHASFRSLLARQLKSGGWQCEPSDRRHWSVWSFTRRKIRLKSSRD